MTASTQLAGKQGTAADTLLKRALEGWPRRGAALGPCWRRLTPSSWGLGRVLVTLSRTACPLAGSGALAGCCCTPERGPAANLSELALPALLGDETGSGLQDCCRESGLGREKGAVAVRRPVPAEMRDVSVSCLGALAPPADATPNVIKQASKAAL